MASVLCKCKAYMINEDYTEFCSIPESTKKKSPEGPSCTEWQKSWNLTIEFSKLWRFKCLFTKHTILQVMIQWDRIRIFTYRKRFRGLCTIAQNWSQASISITPIHFYIQVLLYRKNQIHYNFSLFLAKKRLLTYQKIFYLWI